MWKDNASKIDMLFYKPYADIISDTAINTDENPFTVSVCGIWDAFWKKLLGDEKNELRNGAMHINKKFAESEKQDIQVKKQDIESEKQDIQVEK